MTSQEIQKALIQLASDLVCGKLLPEIDTEHWYASTPLAERRQICKAMEVACERHKVLGLKVRDLYDAVGRRTTMQSAQTQAGD
jgi:hypothetical protein